MTINSGVNNNRPIPDPTVKKTRWSKNKKIGVIVLVLLAIIGVVSVVVVPSENEQLSKQTSISDTEKPRDYESDRLNPIGDQPAIRGPNGMQP
jgi:hypothetical protein